MAISFVGATTEPVSSVNSKAINVPAGTQIGDVLVFSASWRASQTISAPAALTEAGQSNTGTNNSNLRAGAWIRAVQAGDPTSYTFNWSAPALGNLSCSVYRGVDNTTPQDAAWQSSQVTSATPDCPSITTVTSGAWLINHLARNNAADLVATPPAGMDKRYEANAEQRTIAGASESRPTAGATGTRVWTLPGSALCLAITMALRPAAELITPAVEVSWVTMETPIAAITPTVEVSWAALAMPYPAALPGIEVAWVGFEAPVELPDEPPEPATEHVGSVQI
jgi:hypothetical protein